MALVLICAVLFGFSLTAFAGDGTRRLEDPQGGILSVAHRGETLHHTPNTPDAVVAAAELGADFVSVSLTKTAGEFVLLTDQQKQTVPDAGQMTLLQLQTALFGAGSSEKVPTLAAVSKALSGRAGLIVDFDVAHLDALYEYLQAHELTASVLPRVTMPAKEIVAFAKGHPDLRLIGVYRGNVVMNAISHLNRLSAAGMPAVQYQSKNYFCVSFQRFTAKRFSVDGHCRAMVNMTNPALCALRDDDLLGWDDMISRDFSVIETGDIRALCTYLQEREKTASALNAMLEAARSAPESRALTAAMETGEAALSANASLSARQRALSALQNARALPAAPQEGIPKKGTLQITTGKVLTVLFFAVLVLAVQVYMHKKQQPTKGVK